MICAALLLCQSSSVTLNLGGVNIRSTIPVCYQEAETFYYLAFSPSPRRVLVLTDNHSFALTISRTERPVVGTFELMTGKGVKIGDSEQELKLKIGLPNRIDYKGNRQEYVYIVKILLGQKLWEHREVYQLENNALKEIRIVETDTNG